MRRFRFCAGLFRTSSVCILRVWTALAVLIAAFGLTVGAFAQSVRGVLSGSVTDPDRGGCRRSKH